LSTEPGQGIQTFDPNLGTENDRLSDVQPELPHLPEQLVPDGLFYPVFLGHADLFKRC
jgi:hypothetical protein